MVAGPDRGAKGALVVFATRGHLIVGAEIVRAEAWAALREGVSRGASQVGPDLSASGRAGRQSTSCRVPCEEG